MSKLIIRYNKNVESESNIEDERKFGNFSINSTRGKSR